MILIKNAQIVNSIDNKLEKADILIVDDKIEKIGKT